MELIGNKTSHSEHQQSIVSPDDGITCRNIYWVVNSVYIYWAPIYILSTTLVFYFVIPPSVSLIVIYRYLGCKYSTLIPTSYIRITNPAFYFVILPSVSPVVIVIMYHLVPTPESFEIMCGDRLILHWNVHIMPLSVFHIWGVNSKRVIENIFINNLIKF
jgi:hypothetical protein